MFCYIDNCIFFISYKVCFKEYIWEICDFYRRLNKYSLIVKIKEIKDFVGKYFNMSDYKLVGMI